MYLLRRKSGSFWFTALPFREGNSKGFFGWQSFLYFLVPSGVDPGTCCRTFQFPFQLETLNQHCYCVLGWCRTRHCSREFGLVHLFIVTAQVGISYVTFGGPFADGNSVETEL